jgi:hypothetical protein
MVKTRKNRKNSVVVEDNETDQQILDTSNNEDEQDVESDDDSAQQDIKPKIQIFKGMDDKVSIENWLKRFEMLSFYYKWSERKRIIMLGNYLEDDALNWYIENTDNSNYNELKEKLINRFGVQTVEPIVEFFNLKYDSKSGVKEYFEKKRRFGVLAKLTEQQMIPIMIQGLHPKMVNNFISVKPKTFSEFYHIAKTAEDTFKRSLENFNKTRFKPKPQNFQNNNLKPKAKPPNPCKICANLGFKNRYHWVSDCFNKNKAPNTQTKQINVTEVKSENSDNSINNIDLN